MTMNVENPKDPSISPEPGSRRKESPEYVNVAVAIIEQDGKFLIGKRAGGHAYVGRWEFPGGKIEKGETAEHALSREIDEELGMRLSPATPYLEFCYRFSDGNLFQIISFQCLIEREPELRDHSEFLWASLEEMRSLQFVEADNELIESLRAAQSLAEGHITTNGENAS